MKSLLPLSLVTLLLLGCASHTKRLDCERHLKPINAPAPVASTGAHP
jgi:hypothetical protein